MAECQNCPETVWTVFLFLSDHQTHRKACDLGCFFFSQGLRNWEHVTPDNIYNGIKLLWNVKENKDMVWRTRALLTWYRRSKTKQTLTICWLNAAPRTYIDIRKLSFGRYLGNDEPFVQVPEPVLDPCTRWPAAHWCLLASPAPPGPSHRARAAAATSKSLWEAAGICAAPSGHRKARGSAR